MQEKAYVEASYLRLDLSSYFPAVSSFTIHTNKNKVTAEQEMYKKHFLHDNFRFQKIGST